MIFPCPKCSAKTEQDITHIPEEGTSAKCPECKSRFWIIKESFARRAIRKEGPSLCCYCNNELSNYLDCPTCGATYPDVCVAQMSKPVKRKRRKTSAQISFSIRPERRTQVRTAQQSTERASKPVLTRITLLALVAVVAVGAGAFYFNKRVEDQYAARFLQAVYAIKLGTDLSFSQCATYVATGKEMTGGKQLTLTLGDKEKKRLDSAKSDIDTLMQRLPEPPKKFSKANDNLSKLYGIYTRSYTLAASPSGSVATFADSANKLEGEFKQAAQEFKTSLPPVLAAKYKAAQTKFKELQNL